MCIIYTSGKRTAVQLPSGHLSTWLDMNMLKSKKGKQLAKEGRVITFNCHPV